MTNPIPPYVKRRIRVTVKLGQGSFGASGSNTVILEGLRVAVQIESAVLPSPQQAVIRIFGMTLSNINELSNCGLLWMIRENVVVVEAGDDVSGMRKVFTGIIWEARPEFMTQPQTSFLIMASYGGDLQLKPVKPVSFDGSVNLQTALDKIVGQTPLKLELSPDIRDITFSNPYFKGTAMEQINTAVRAADSIAALDYFREVVAVWPRDGSREVGGIPVISPDTGMIGYPMFEKNSINVRTVWDPTLHSPSDALPGTKVRVESELKAANGVWSIDRIDYLLVSEMPDGPWELRLQAHPEQFGSFASRNEPTAV
jgi:hypothetical protein